jgi:hypothetical protein
MSLLVRASRLCAPQLDKGDINARIRLTYLSPNLAWKLVNGEMASTLNPTRPLEASKDLPLKWADQGRFIKALAIGRPSAPSVSASRTSCITARITSCNPSVFESGMSLTEALADFTSLLVMAAILSGNQ